ncbi:hypothetical protein EUAN_14400 [Andreesenia angusta]|uniref:Virus attachment protein p12 family protein n=1 Tax=Andreesenia angusta TaxID=39480 RepID=A0A1S1V5Z6_9FIRM|nr:FeoB-associated Cys-rich membrane protein [Andreesenia angusta]OHW61992.1 hypothetical protein EUAN_14400 [Andreesenia angusta]
MMASVVIGAVFFGIVGYGAYRSVNSMKNNSCPGCSGGCSEQQRKDCR